MYVWIRCVAPSHSANACHPEQLDRLNRNSSCKKLQPLLQNVWRKVEYRVDVCRATTDACLELVLGVKEFPVYSGVRSRFVWLLPLYQYVFVIALIFCDRPVYRAVRTLGRVHPAMK
jgi:hypothetical protein